MQRGHPDMVSKCAGPATPTPDFTQKCLSQVHRTEVGALVMQGGCATSEIRVQAQSSNSVEPRRWCSSRCGVTEKMVCGFNGESSRLFGRSVWVAIGLVGSVGGCRGWMVVLVLLFGFFVVTCSCVDHVSNKGLSGFLGSPSLLSVFLFFLRLCWCVVSLVAGFSHGLLFWWVVFCGGVVCVALWFLLVAV
ncbi:hypothetical protein Ancab_004552 [Ancistrocladus abbreviatus]